LQSKLQPKSQPVKVQRFIDVDEYILGIGDKLAINVYNQEKLSGEFVVNTQGKISMPLLENISAAGLTIQQLKKKIKSALYPDYLNNPKVSIQIINYRNIYILGEVEKPGKYEYLPNMTLIQAIATAEGYTPRAAEGKATLRRQAGNKIDMSEVDEDTTLRAGDILTIKRRWF
jgi:polysaccharide export outer membrane protein